MRKSILGKTGLAVSAVTYGGIINMNETDADTARYVGHAIESGINYFDVAPSYGDAQDRLGPALEPYRKNVFFACKTEKRDAAGAKADLLNSLKLLRTDHFDVYQLHAMRTSEDVEQAFGKDGAMETFLWAKREGLVANIGFSTHDEDTALRCLDLYDFASVLFPMYWAMGINQGWGDRISERVKQTGAGLLAMKTLIHRAWLNDDERKAYPKSWCKPIYEDEALGVAAMKYGLSKGAATLVPPGNYEHFCFMLDHIDTCLSEPLSDAEWALLRAEAEAVKAHPIF